MILCITPDQGVYRYADSTPESKLQQLYDGNCVILRIQAGGLYGEIEVEEWIGEDEDVPAIGWTRVEYRSPSIE